MRLLIRLGLLVIISSGKMGYALAHELKRHGAEVLLISGPVSLNPPEGVSIVKVTTADEMYDACVENYPNYDIAIMNAAVADYAPIEKFDKKVKRKSDDMKIELKPTRDIAQKLGEMKSGSQFLVGFALETDNEMDNAFDKLKKKNLDCIVLNSLQDEGAGFNYDTNKVTVVDSNNNITKFELKSKQEIARDIINELNKQFHND